MFRREDFVAKKDMLLHDVFTEIKKNNELLQELVDIQKAQQKPIQPTKTPEKKSTVRRASKSAE